MHASQLRPDTIERARLNRGGQDRAYREIDPARTAHLIVDMQNGFIVPGAPAEVPTAREIIGNVNQISDAVAKAGGHNVFFRFTVDPADDWDVFKDAFGGARMGNGDGHPFHRGRPEHALHDDIEVREGDAIVDKRRFSAFTPGTSTALDVLRDRGIDTVVITGTLTNCCCESTARDAHQLGFRVIFVSDANAALSDEDHNATLNSLAPVFADVVSTSDVLTLLQAAPIPTA